MAILRTTKKGLITRKGHPIALVYVDAGPSVFRDEYCVAKRDQCARRREGSGSHFPVSLTCGKCTKFSHLFQPCRDLKG